MELNSINGLEKLNITKSPLLVKTLVYLKASAHISKRFFLKIIR
jgi:hypothetical protein